MQRRKNEKIVVLLDNASMHAPFGTEERNGFQVYEMSHILWVFLPANTTSLIQPLDMGIIQCFKLKCASMPDCSCEHVHLVSDAIIVYCIVYFMQNKCFVVWHKLR